MSVGEKKWDEQCRRLLKIKWDPEYM